MTKQNIYGNIHTHAYILNLYDLIPKNSQTHPIKFLGMLGNIIYTILYIYIYIYIYIISYILYIYIYINIIYIYKFTGKYMKHKQKNDKLIVH